MYTQYGIREICDVVFKAKSTMTVGSKKFYKGEPVIYFDTLKTSTLEGAATTVYATGGRGNSRLVAWEGERTVTFTMEDALISPVGFMLLSGAGLIEAYDGREKEVAQVETKEYLGDGESSFEFELAHTPSGEVHGEFIPNSGIISETVLEVEAINIENNILSIDIKNNEVVKSNVTINGSVSYNYEISGELIKNELFEAKITGYNPTHTPDNSFEHILENEPINDEVTVIGGTLNGGPVNFEDILESVVVDETNKKKVIITFKEEQTQNIQMGLAYKYNGVEQKNYTQTIEFIADTDNQPSIEVELDHTPVEGSVQVKNLKTMAEDNSINIIDIAVIGQLVIVTTDKPVNVPATLTLTYNYYVDGNAANVKVIYQHVAETVAKDNVTALGVAKVNQVAASQKEENGAIVYILPLKNGKMFTEPYIGTADNKKEVSLAKEYLALGGTDTVDYEGVNWAEDYKAADAFLIDYYTPRYENAIQIDITPDSFGGNFYIEASTLFRDTNGSDYPAEFIIPNAKIQSNFSFSMASSGDPSTFTFTCDAFPDYTRFNKTKKVIAALQVITGGSGSEEYRTATAHN